MEKVIPTDSEGWAKEASYDEYARVKVVTSTAGTSGPDGWWDVTPVKEEGGVINFPGPGQFHTINTNKLQINTPPDCKDLLDIRFMEQLLGEAGQSSLHDLANLWQARWSTNWVKRGEIDGDFWEVAAARLHASGRLEAHVLADGTRVFKLDNE